jgi:hypothetical protein
LDAATICIAFVIWAVLRMDLIRRRMSRVFAITNYLLQSLQIRHGLIARSF